MHKKGCSKTEFINRYWYTAKVEKERRGGTYHTIPWFVKANNKYMNVYKKDKEPSYLMYWYAKDLHGQPMSEKLPADNFE